jgi:tetratricopeptide (TPR) repeat protein
MITNALALLAAIGGVQAGQTQQPPPDADALSHIASAMDAIRANDAARANAQLDQAISYYESLYAGEKRHIYCGMNGSETILYMMMGSKDKQGAVAVSPGWCTSLFLKGYLSVDAGQIDEARKYYERVIALAPMHWQYKDELGFTYRKSDPAKSLDLFKEAEGEVGFLDAPDRPFALTKVRHGEGYALTELKRFDEAEAIYRQCLKIDPKDDYAQQELKYIAEQRAKPQ